MSRVYSIDETFEELTLNKELVDPLYPEFQGYSRFSKGQGINLQYWSYWFPFTVPNDWNKRNLKDIVFRNNKGQRHRIFGPAYVSELYDIEAWFFEDKLHRDGNWAYRHKGNFLWFKHGVPHNLNGPAVVEGGGPLQYWIDGIRLSPKQYRLEINRRKRKGKL